MAINISLPEFLAPFRSSPEELIYWRVIAPDGAPAHLIRDYDKQVSPPASIKGKAAYSRLSEGSDYLKELRGHNKKRGVYFVVNPGGHKDLDIERYVATFSESDPPKDADIEKFLDEQLAIEPPVPPSAVMVTRKSVHRYWLIDGPCTREEWLKLQQGQIAFYHSDPSIMNESRVMRLPGFNHVRVDFVNDCLLYKPIEPRSFNPERRYTAAELQESFPVGPEGLVKVFEKLSRPDYKKASIELTDELRGEVEVIRKRPRSSSVKAPKNTAHDKITTLAEVLQRQRIGERLRRIAIEPADYGDSGIEPAGAELIEGTIARICLQLANARQGTKDNTLLHCGKILYGLVKGELADEGRITALLRGAVALAGAGDPQFDPIHAEQTARNAYNYAEATTLEDLRLRRREHKSAPSAGNPMASDAPPEEPPEWLDSDLDPDRKPAEAHSSKDDDPAAFGPGFYTSLRELHAKETVPADDLMIGVRRRQVTIFASVTSVGKTTIMLNHALAAAGGQRWSPLLPEKPDRPLKIVFIDAESTDDELKKDTLKMLDTIGKKDLALDNFIPIVDATIDGEALNLSTRKHFEHIKRFLKYHQPDIAIFDTISALFTLYSENDNAEVVRKVIRPLKELAVAGNCAIWASHHIGKSGESDDAEEAYRGRGASAFGANVRGVITLRREKALGDGYVRLTLGKSKGNKLDPVNLKLDFAKRTFEILVEAPKVETPYQQVIGLFNGQPLKTKEIKKLLSKLSGRTVDDALKLAVKNGDLEKVTTGVYRKPGQKSAENPTSQTSQSPIGIAKFAKSSQPVENAEDGGDWPEWAENDDCEVLDAGPEGDLEVF